MSRIHEPLKKAELEAPAAALQRAAELPVAGERGEHCGGDVIQLHDGRRDGSG